MDTQHTTKVNSNNCDCIYKMKVRRQVIKAAQLQAVSILSQRILLKKEKLLIGRSTIGKNYMLRVLLGCLENDNSSTKVKFLAVQALAKYMKNSTVRTKKLCNLGAVPIFCKLLISISWRVVEQAVRALATILDLEPQFRPYIIEYQAITLVMHFIELDISNSFWRTIGKFFKNMCKVTRDIEQISDDVASDILPSLEFLSNSEDRQVSNDARCAIIYLKLRTPKISIDKFPLSDIYRS